MSRRSKKRVGTSTAFVMLHIYLLKSEAWRKLSSGAKETYIELKVLYNGKNNGRIGFGARGGGEVLGVSKSTVNRHLNELEFYGFIVRAKDSSFAQKKNTIEWLLTEARNDITGELPLKTFLKWRPDPTSTLVPSPVLKHDPASTKGNLLPVPAMEGIVPPVGRKRNFDDALAAISLTSGTNLEIHAGPQSYERDTYTSKPAGEPVLGWTRAALAGAVRGYLEEQQVANFESSTPYAIRISDDIWDSLINDPFLSVMKDTFPGAVVVLDRSDFEASRKKLGHGN
jgi:DNA-binding MarR family transcriptional regulator